MSLPLDPSMLEPVRLHPGADLRQALQDCVAARGLEAAFVVSGIGSLSVAALRLAGAAQATVLEGEFEILSLAGSLAPRASHLHLSVADAGGRVLGGHAAPGCIVRTTAEVLLALLPGWQFTREPDAATGYDELVIRPRDQGRAR